MAGATPPTSATPRTTGTLPQAFQVVEDDKPASCYQEIADLCLIKNADPVFQAALDEWDREVKDLTILVDRREKRSADLKNEIYIIVGFFTAFQGVVLNDVCHLAANQTSGTTFLCGKIWSPILLTLFATFVTCVGVLYKFAELRALEHSIQIEKQGQAEAARRGMTLRRLGPEKFRFKRDASNSKVFKKPKSFWRDSIFVISILVFTTLFILSYIRILCDFSVGVKPPMNSLKMIN